MIPLFNKLNIFTIDDYEKNKDNVYDEIKNKYVNLATKKLVFYYLFMFEKYYNINVDDIQQNISDVINNIKENAKKVDKILPDFPSLIQLQKKLNITIKCFT